MRVVASKTLIDLVKGWPSPQLYPIDLIKTASTVALSKPDVLTAQSALNYGPDLGYPPLRENIAVWLSKFYRPDISISTDRICITGGASQNLACILQVFSDPFLTRNVWLVTPTYFHASRIFEDAGFHGRLRAVPEDEEGLDIEYLTEALRKSENEGPRGNTSEQPLKPQRPYRKFYRHLIYAVPTFANPSSKTMSLLRRQQLVRLARQYDALIITDDVYDQLQWPAEDTSRQSASKHAHLPRIVDIDRTLDSGAEREGADGFGNAVSSGSFSKIMGPGCRTGWAEGTGKLAFGLAQCGSTKSGGAPSQLVASFMSCLLERGDLQRHIIERLQPAYARRYRVMMDAVEEHLVPLGVSLPQRDRKVMGGYFIWLQLPRDLQADEVATRAREDEELAIAPGCVSAVWGDEQAVDLGRNVRLSFAWEKEEVLVEGVARLAKVIQAAAPAPP